MDYASEITQRETEARIAAVREAQEQHLRNKGACYNCDELIEELFCDEDCRDDYEWREERRRANGG